MPKKDSPQRRRDFDIIQTPNADKTAWKLIHEGNWMDYCIRDAFRADVSIIVDLIRNSFRDVADRFCLTEKNCPKHPSNCKPSWIESSLQKGARYFILEKEGVPCGCVALERVQPELCYLERLGVVPQFRGRGFGKALVQHALAEADAMGSYRVEIGIISAHTELKNWYRGLGFTETGTARFKHLPFEVTFLAKKCRQWAL